MGFLLTISQISLLLCSTPSKGLIVLKPNKVLPNPDQPAQPALELWPHPTPAPHSLGDRHAGLLGFSGAQRAHCCLRPFALAISPCPDSSSCIFLYCSPPSILCLNIIFPGRISQFLHSRLHPHSTRSSYPILGFVCLSLLHHKFHESRDECVLLPSLQFLKHVLACDD